MKYNSIHGRRDGNIEVDGDSLVNDSQKVSLSHTREPAESPFAEHGAEYVSESAAIFLTTETVQPTSRRLPRGFVLRAGQGPFAHRRHGREPGDVRRVRPRCGRPQAERLRLRHRGPRRPAGAARRPQRGGWPPRGQGVRHLRLQQCHWPALACQYWCVPCPGRCGPVVWRGVP